MSLRAIFKIQFHSCLLHIQYQLRRNDNFILLESPRFKTKITMGSNRSFMVATPVTCGTAFLCQQTTLFTVLTKKIRDCEQPISRPAENIDSYKRLLKTYLFSRAFCQDFKYSFMTYMYNYQLLLLLFTFLMAFKHTGTPVDIFLS